MKKIRKLFSIFALLFFSACVSTEVSRGKETFDPEFDRIKINDSTSDTEKKVGPPSNIVRDSEGEHWIYDNNDKDAFQRAAISFDKKTKVVSWITLIPKIDDIDSKLDYLQKQKLTASDYVVAPLERCHRDYFPREVFYISPSKGFIIELDRLQNSVESYSWTSPELAVDLLKKIKNCER